MTVLSVIVNLKPVFDAAGSAACFSVLSTSVAKGSMLGFAALFTALAAASAPAGVSLRSTVSLGEEAGAVCGLFGDSLGGSTVIFLLSGSLNAPVLNCPVFLFSSFFLNYPESVYGALELSLPVFRFLACISSIVFCLARPVRII